MQETTRLIHNRRKVRRTAPQAGRGQNEGRVNTVLGADLKRRAEAKITKQGLGWSEYIRALVAQDLA
jgi:hypothetical protein